MKPSNNLTESAKPDGSVNFIDRLTLHIKQIKPNKSTPLTKSSRATSTSSIKDKDGNVLTGSKEENERWRERFEELYNKACPDDTSIHQSILNSVPSKVFEFGPILSNLTKLDGFLRQNY